jgi:hypothetical protein
MIFFFYRYAILHMNIILHAGICLKIEFYIHILWRLYSQN